MRITLAVEFTLALVLAVRFATQWGMPLGEAAWQGLFHAVSAFNNAGFSTFSDSVMRFQADAVILVPIALAVVISALGFPVMEDWRVHGRRWRQ